MRNHTIASQLGITDFPFIIKDKDGYEIYHERADGSWHKRKYDIRFGLLSFEDSTGAWSEHRYNQFGRHIFTEEHKGSGSKIWFKTEYDDKGERIYYETDGGIQQDDRKNKLETV